MLKGSTNIGPGAWARLSICMSIKQKGMPNPDEYNTDGSELAPSKLFPYNQNLYLALMINRLKQDKLDPETYLNEMTRAHLNRGAISIKQRVNKPTDIYNLVEAMGVKIKDVDPRKYTDV